MKFHKTYFFLFIFLFIVEICIAYFLKTGFIRHTFGDFLIVIMLYCFFKSFINIKPMYMAIIVLLISFIIEFLQLYLFIEWLGLQDSEVAKLILGSTFHFSDLLAYTLGVVSVIIIELNLN